MATGSKASAALRVLSDVRCHAGQLRRFAHQSKELGCEMRLSVFTPPAPPQGAASFPVLWYLSGLTCTDENVMQKSSCQSAAAEFGVAIVAPDTSPRAPEGEELVEGENKDWDFGSGAGFYVDAARSPWDKNYRMYSYVTEELPELLKAEMPELQVGTSESICGHSMGGHGALVLALKNPGRYKSCSAFAPIANPVECPWGEKAFSGYLGEDKAQWRQWDATHLVRSYSGPELHFLIDQGTEDGFYKNEPKQLLPENFEAACKEAGVPLSLHFREGYDHSYYFIQSFMRDHVAHHAKFLKEH
jgi:S-formylglutathione hydrolase